ncbi:hypothetical protein BH11MYX2_BH11MYX2_18340 [soil metagenome]
MAGKKRVPPEQTTTDDSLRAERRKTDVKLTESLDSIKAGADALLSEARDKADSALGDTREREDQLLASVGRTTGAVRQLNSDRAAEDVAVAAARVSADTAATDELAHREKALANLLEFERKDTDLRLKLERNRSEESLASRENFLAMVSHDLRSLLGGIVLSADLLGGSSDGVQAAPHIQRYAASIHRFSARMERLIGDLMDVSSMEAGKLAMIPELVDVGVLVRDLVGTFQLASANHGIELSSEVAADLALVSLDRERIQQVLTNLVGNALKFTDRGGFITIRVALVDELVQFSVTDTGHGIPAEHVGKIFDRFVQLDPTDRRGLGLGLYIAKSIVDGHRGRIWAESTLGKGSTFFFALPLR